MAFSSGTSFPRFRGTVKEVVLPERPACPACGQRMRVTAHGRPRPVVGLAEDYHVTTAYYACGHAECPRYKRDPVHAPNPHAPPGGAFDFEVIARVCELRWQERRTYEEVVAALEARHGITMTTNTVERMLKTYEAACEARYRPGVVAKVKANGGVILSVDGMQPLKGNKPFYACYDALTGTPLGARKLPSQKEGVIAAFLGEVQARVREELECEVVAVVSDALPAQRKAIDAVFPGARHCLCHFHVRQESCATECRTDWRDPVETAA